MCVCVFFDVGWCVLGPSLGKLRESAEKAPQLQTTGFSITEIQVQTVQKLISIS